MYIYVCVYVYIYMLIYTSIYLSVYLSVYLSISVSIHLSSGFSLERFSFVGILLFSCWDIVCFCWDDQHMQNMRMQVCMFVHPSIYFSGFFQCSKRAYPKVQAAIVHNRPLIDPREPWWSIIVPIWVGCPYLSALWALVVLHGLIGEPPAL